MTLYLVCVDVTAFGYLEIEADSVEEAMDKAAEANPRDVEVEEVTSIDVIAWVDPLLKGE